MNNSLEQFKALLRGKLHTKISEDHVQSLLSVRRGREALFGPHLFSDPAWDILLELYAANLGGRTTSSHELTKAIGAPHSIIKRWIRALMDAGLVEVRESKRGMGNESVILTDEGAAKMAQLVDQWGTAFLTI